ncbi:MAG TPA: DUF1780 domain-containing protein [Usitatibacter sp.]|nr:DUF1780 domain-containing protein [Usitatibacter sp.]
MASRNVKQRLLEDMRDGLRQSVEYFSSSNKGERERWCCQEFVRNLNVRPWSRSFVSPDEDPPDVIYRDARFEVKEVLDAGRRRHHEYRQALEEALGAKDPAELMKEYSPKDITPLQVGELVQSQVHKLRRKYDPKLQRSLDLLVYVNLLETLLGRGAMPNPAAFENSGWRSVSALFGWNSLVFYAERSAPKLIRDSAGAVVLRARKLVESQPNRKK